jgi:hypothetical protein
MKQLAKVSGQVIIGLLILTTFSRILPHPPNFTSLIAVSVFGGMMIRSRVLAIATPVLAYFLSDLFLNNVTYGAYHSSFVLFAPHQLYVIISILIICLVSVLFKKKSNGLLAGSTGVILFYIITNFGVWATTTMYAPDFSGLIACYIAGIPFLLNSFAGTLFYGTLLYAGYEFLMTKFVKQERL